MADDVCLFWLARTVEPSESKRDDGQTKKDKKKVAEGSLSCGEKPDEHPSEDDEVDQQRDDQEHDTDETPILFFEA